MAARPSIVPSVKRNGSKPRLLSEPYSITTRIDRARPVNIRDMFCAACALVQIDDSRRLAARLIPPVWLLF